MKFVSDIGIKALGIHEPVSAISINDARIRENINEEVINYMGIKEVHVACKDEHPCDMAVSAAQKAIESARISPDQIDIVIYTNTFLPEYPMWADYSHIQDRLGIKNAYSFKINQSCNSQLLALDYARSKLYMDSGIRNVLVVSSERWDYNYINRFISAGSCFYGDGASAAIISKGISERKIIDMDFYTDGSYAGLHYIPTGGTKHAPDYNSIDNQLYRFEPRITCKQHLDTREAKDRFWRLIIDNNIKLLDRMLEKHKLGYCDIKKLITYNMSKKVVKSISERTGKDLSETSFYIAEQYGHIGSTDICFNLYKMIQDEMVQPGDLVAVISAGFGFSWGVGIIQI